MKTRFSSFVAALALAAPFVVPAAPAGADPFTAHFDALRTALQTRFDALTPESPVLQARERRAAGVALQWIARPSASFESDLKLLARVALRVEVPAAETPEIQTALAAAAGGLRTDLGAARNLLALQVTDVLQSSLQAKLARALEKVDVELLAADAGTSVTERARGMVRTQRRMSSASQIVARANACRGKPGAMGRGYVASRIGGAVVEAERGGAIVSFDGTKTLTNVIVLGHGGADDPVTYRIEWATGVFTGTGLYDATAGSGVFVTVDDGGGPVDATECQLLVTEFDAAARRIAGRFDGRLADGTLFSSGRFRVCGYGTETLE